MSQPMPPEWWVPVVGYEGFYEVSDYGRVKSLPRMTQKGLRGGRILKGIPTPQGHLAVTLSVHGNMRRWMIHHLVAEAFIGPRPPGLETRHLNDVPWDNRPANLCYGTRKENIADMIRNGHNYYSNRTHCPKKHPYDEANTYRAPRGGRGCRACMNDKSKRRNKRQRHGIGKLCVVPGCDRAQIAKGLCSRCYVRQSRADARGPDWSKRVCPQCSGEFELEPGQPPRKYCSGICAATVKRIASRDRARRRAAAA